jgi:hypothetical protein
MNRRWTRPTAGLVAAAALFLVSPRAHSRPPVPFNLDSHAFRFILWQEALAPQTSLDDLDREPARSLLIVFGDTRELDRRGEGWLRSFLDRGGAVLIATDRGEPNPQPWERTLGVHVRGDLVQAHDPKSMYRGSPDCPILRPAQPAPAQPLPRLRVSLPVATNRPSCLVPGEGKLEPFLNFPIDCHIAGRPFLLDSIYYPFGMGGKRGTGRVLVLADHSVFINGMMLQPDNGNFDFAYACVEWLRQRDGSGVKRDRAMFIDDGMVFSSFEVPVTLEPDAGPSPVELADQLIAQVEQDDLFNRLILQNIPLRRIVRGLVVIGTVLLLVLGLYRLIRAGYHLEPHVPLVSRRVAPVIAAPAVVDQRHHALLRQGNLWEAARDLARACFAGLGIPTASATAGTDWPLIVPAALPRVRTNTDWRRRRALRQTVYQLWRLACSPRPRRISRRRFTQLVNQVEAVKAAVRDGTLHITGPGETP